MPGLIAKSGDLLVPMFAPVIFLPPTLPIIGTSAILVNGLPACLLEDLELSVAEPVEYTEPPLFLTPGMGIFELIPTPANFTERTLTMLGPLAIIEAPIPALFTVVVPAFNPATIPAPTPDLVIEKPGEFEIVPAPPAPAVLAG
ncbi:hypothetical protein AB0D08_11440 [Kitasatospora sp. NPDC048540]|uniref:hypothetical protein n=1 Tax=unclassified Kitasatospora TaxID=2633591 RepID=UPI0011EA70BA|nr:hypothetical protein [Kitasatospora sp. MBT63]